MLESPPDATAAEEKRLPSPGAAEPDTVPDAELVELVREFTDDLPRQIEGIHEALRENDAASLRRHVHQLGGAAALYGIEALSATARGIERCIVEDVETRHLSTLVRALTDLCENIDAKDLAIRCQQRLCCPRAGR
jgi:HPt (histidine-containing phosphotransfer) domain-containing protein